jgi:hypothetical protein
MRPLLAFLVLWAGLSALVIAHNYGWWCLAGAVVCGVCIVARDKVMGYV